MNGEGSNTYAPWITMHDTPTLVVDERHVVPAPERCPTCGSDDPLTYLIRIAQDSTVGLPWGSDPCSDPWHKEQL